MADRGAEMRDRETPPAPLIAELLLAGQFSNLALALMGVACVAIAGLAGYGLLQLQEHFADEVASGQSLSGLAALAAEGSSLRTAWPGWLAAVFFAISILRLLRGEPEPPMGRGSPESQSVAQLRSGLRREYTSVRIALIVVTALALLDACRLAASAVASVQGNSIPKATLTGTAIEAAGLMVAAVLLGVWAWLFHRELQRWGAV